MSNVQTVRQILEALESGDADAFRKHLAEDVRWEYHPTGNTAQERDVPYMRLRNGREAAAGFIDDIEEDFEMNSLELKSFLEGENLVAVLIGYELTVRATGKRVRDEEIHLYELGADGKVSTFRHFLDTAKAIEAHS
jgi:ketosteroid isomerase-like protein